MASKSGDQSPGLYPAPSEADQKRARAWFQRAHTVAETRNYDYAIECFINGLGQWPDTVDEGHGPLRLVGLQRKQAGGKKPGMMEKMPASGKDALKAMLNAEKLLSKDPGNIEYTQTLFKNAGRAGLINTTLWIGPILLELCQQEKKPNVARFQTLRSVNEDLSNRAEAAGELEAALKLREAALQALEYARRINPQDMGLQEEVRDLSSRLTLLKGNYERAQSFRESVADAGAQQDIRDRERLVQSDERVEDMIARARADMEANPGVAAKVFALTDLLTKRDKAEDENQAVELLTRVYKESGNYQFKRRADDIRMKQLTRAARKILAQKDKEAAQKHLAKQLEFEIGVFRERIENYPTDLSLKYELGKRLMKAGKWDDAIPHFQEARGDPKYRVRCNMYVGSCFYQKGYFNQAIDTFNAVNKEYEIPGDEVSKEIHYWLGRSYEAAGKPEEAGKVYGQVIQWDYNYKDVRQRLDAMRKSGGSPGASS